MTLTIEKLGRRFYVRGNTYAIRDQLRAVGCRWDSDERAWWTGKQEIADRFSGDVQPTEQSAENEKADELSSKRCYGKVRYKGRSYYVVGMSERTEKLRLTVLDCSIDFWAPEQACSWEKRYQVQTRWGGYGRGQVETFQTVGQIRRFIERRKNEERQIARGERPDGWCVDLEDGCLKPRNECDMPSE